MNQSYVNLVHKICSHFTKENVKGPTFLPNFCPIFAFFFFLKKNNNVENEKKS
jgi:hypothetical protein